ncbi:MAG: site-2 protease family protein [Thiomargarita sp.]|nr:site-2 protease family protein [Thiomargarita sp.]
MNGLSTLQQVMIWVVPILFAVTVHEVAHGWVALKCGDDTAKQLGRLTLNPIKHIDLIGTIILPAILLMTSGFMFGWAKPVPVNFSRLKQPRRDMAFVALAGPFANLLMAIFWLIITKIGWVMVESMPFTAFLIFVGTAGLFINIVLMLLNLLPILPLDGGRILYSLLPPRWAYYFGKLEILGLPLLIILFFTGILGKILLTPLLMMHVLFGGSIEILRYILS